MLSALFNISKTVHVTNKTLYEGREHRGPNPSANLEVNSPFIFFIELRSDVMSSGPEVKIQCIFSIGIS